MQSPDYAPVRRRPRVEIFECRRRRDPSLAKCFFSLQFRRAWGQGGLMDIHRDWVADDADDRAIRFEGNWREYLPIAATNALLIIGRSASTDSGRRRGSGAIFGRERTSSTTGWNGPVPAKRCSSAS
jgi:hypothetical protein